LPRKRKFWIGKILFCDLEILFWNSQKKPFKLVDLGIRVVFTTQTCKSQKNPNQKPKDKYSLVCDSLSKNSSIALFTSFGTERFPKGSEKSKIEFREVMAESARRRG